MNTSSGRYQQWFICAVLTKQMKSMIWLSTTSSPHSFTSPFHIIPTPNPPCHTYVPHPHPSPSPYFLSETILNMLSPPSPFIIHHLAIHSPICFLIHYPPVLYFAMSLSLVLALATALTLALMLAMVMVDVGNDAFIASTFVLGCVRISMMFDLARAYDFVQ